jgi:L-ascorbate metabolism protein UlaG (beta-lactamase superfamily)
MKIGEINLKWLGHSGFLIENSGIIYIDPFQIKENLPKADYILLTHGHYDHCSVEDIGKIIKEGTKIIATADCQSNINKFEIPIKVEIVEPFQDFDFGKIKISTIPAYNINKNFHTKNDNFVGYIVKINDALIYHAGDTDFIPEMQKLTGYNHKNINFVALVPVSGKYVMGVDEAVEAAKLLKPTIAIPMHWGSIVGSKEDAEEFVQICTENGIDARVLEKD